MMNDWNGHNEAVQRAMDNLGTTESYDKLYDILHSEFNKYRDNLESLSPLRAYIDYFGRDDIDVLMDTAPEPVLYGTLLGDAECIYGSTILKGSTVRITMVSKLGDIGVTTNLDAPRGFNARVGLNALEDYCTTESTVEDIINSNGNWHVIDIRTGKVLASTEAESFSASVDKYRAYHANDRVSYMYEKGLDIVLVNGPKDLK